MEISVTKIGQIILESFQNYNLIFPIFPATATPEPTTEPKKEPTSEPKKEPTTEPKGKVHNVS